MALIYHYDDVVTLAELSGNLLEAEDRGDDNLPNILAKHGHKLITVGSGFKVSHIGGVELCRDLRLQIQTVIYDDNSGIFQIREHTKLDSGKLHQVRLTRALKVPNQALLGAACPDTVHDHVRALILLVTGDNLILAIFVVSGKQREKLEQVHHLVRSEHIHHTGMYCRQAAIGLIIGGVPGPPFSNGHSDSAIAVALALCGKAEDIRRKHLWNALLVIADILRPVQPGDSGPNRGFHLTNRYGDAVDQQDDIQLFSTVYFRFGKAPVVCDHIVVQVRFPINLGAEKVDGDLPAVLAEGIGVLLKHLLLEQLVLRDEILCVGGRDDAVQVIQDSVGTGFVLGNLRVQPGQRGAEQGLHNDIRGAA